jgi:isoamylase
VPMVLYGDEMRRTTGGNNNTWNQDKLNTLDWSLLEKNADMVRFVRMMIELRKNHEIGRSSPEAISWHGVEPFKPDWSIQSHLVAWQLAPTSPTVKPLFSAFNSYWEPLSVKLPPGDWHRLVDTNLPTGQDIVGPEQATPLGDTYVVQPRSGIVLEGRPQAEKESK